MRDIKRPLSLGKVTHNFSHASGESIGMVEWYIWNGIENHDRRDTHDDARAGRR